MIRLSPARTALLALGLALAGSAQAQLWETPVATAAQPVLRGFAASGNVLTRGSVRITLDVAAGRVIGVLTEASSATDLARGIAAAWGLEESDLPGLERNLAAPALLAAAQKGLVESGDESQTDLIAVRVVGEGAARRWTAYVAVQIWPDSAFPATANVSGGKAAPNTLRIFSDFQCPYCKQLWDSALPEWEAQPEVYRTVHFQFPLDFHKNAFAAAEASECASAQGKFWAYADLLFRDFAGWTKLSPTGAAGKFASYAGPAGLNTGQFQTCLKNRQFRAAVDAQYQAGLRLGVQGTPTVFLNGVKLADYSNADELELVRAVTGARPSAAERITERLKFFR